MHPADNEPHAPHQVTEALQGVTGLRQRQQVCGLWLGIKQGNFAKEDLRDLCKLTTSYNSPNFTRNMRSDKKLFDGDPKTGWTLTIDGYERAVALYGEDVVATPKPAAKVTLADEVENALKGDTPGLEGSAIKPEFESYGPNSDFVEAPGGGFPTVKPHTKGLVIDEVNILPLVLPPDLSNLGGEIENLQKQVTSALGIPGVILDVAGPDAINVVGDGLIDYKTADGLQVCGENSAGGMTAYPNVEVMPPVYVTEAAHDAALASAKDALDALEAPVAPAIGTMTGTALAALQASYKAKSEPTFVPPPHEERGPFMLGALGKKLGL
jgi:hypothetical protein